MESSGKKGFTVLNPGVLTTVQDFGRIGYQQFGVSVSGAMDPRAMRFANLLVGNPENEAVLECTMLGPQLQFDETTIIAVTGGNLGPTLDGQPLKTYCAYKVNAGQTLRFAGLRSGCRAYIAFAGGLDIPEVMGSRSTYMKAKIGGFKGRKLEKGDEDRRLQGQEAGKGRRHRLPRPEIGAVQPGQTEPDAGIRPAGCLHASCHHGTPGRHVHGRRHQDLPL